MKKHLSVLALYARNNFSRILVLLIAVSALDVLIFRLHWNRLSYRFTDGLPVPMEEMLPGIPLAFYLSLVLLSSLLSHSSDDAQSTGYTFQRLRIREETAALWKAVYNAVCILTFWAVQAATALGLCCWYAAAIPGQYRSSQTVFLAFYRDTYLHNLLPLDNWTRYLCIGALLLALGFTTAVRSYKLRRGSRYGWGFSIFLCGVVAGYFNSCGIADWAIDAFGIVLALVSVAVDASYLINNRRGGSSWN